VATVATIASTMMALAPTDVAGRTNPKQPYAVSELPTASSRIPKKMHRPRRER
jgi:hypothetical protein